jgi:hypothetical protein
LLDSSRKAAIGGCQRDVVGFGIDLGLAKLGDVAGFNGDGAYLFFDPGLPNVVTEYGSIESQRPGNYDPRWGLLAYFSDPPIQYTWRPLHDELIKPFLVDNANLDKAKRIGEAK